jgi:hypothetical protein
LLSPFERFPDGNRRWQLPPTGLLAWQARSRKPALTCLSCRGSIDALHGNYEVQTDPWRLLLPPMINLPPVYAGFAV